MANNTACYDPISKCITLPSDDEGEGIRSILSGSIIEFDDPDFQCGQMLLGEIYEIGEYTSLYHVWRLLICCSYHTFTHCNFAHIYVMLTYPLQL